MGSSADIFRQVRGAVDIVDVIGEHLALKRAGREFKCLCPFHDDHRPSMAVVPHKQIFNCFVCGAVGDVFEFVEKYHKMTKGEALRMLAQRAGIKLPELPGRGGGGPQRDKDGLTARERIANTNEWACDFFEKHLRSAAGKAGLDYLRGRGLTDETMEKFRLGMSPEGWTGMCNAGMRLGISNAALAEAGLVKMRQDGSPYDAFRNRVMFPIVDASGGGGRVIAFGGRILVEKRDEAGNVVEAKYLNSPDSPLFNKSESLYGLNHARQQIIRTRTAIVVEGYMDVIACHQAGVTNVIATLGTALTPEHARILKNYAQSVVLVFDSDDAGRRAADRALEVFVRGSLDIRITSVPDGKDPCDFCIKNGGEPFLKLVEAAPDALAYKWQQLQASFHGTNSLTARQEAVTTYLRFVAAALGEGGGSGGAGIDPVRRGLLLSRIGSLVNMPVGELQGTLKRLGQQERSQYRGPGPQAGPGPAASGSGGPQAAVAGGAGGAEEFPGEVVDEGAPGVSVVKAAPVDMRALKGLAAAEGWVLGAILTEPMVYEKVRGEMTLSLFESFSPLASALLEYFENQGELSDVTMPEIIGMLREVPEGEMVMRQAIELESKTADWVEPANLSPQHAKMLQHLTADRGMNLETLVRDSIRELQRSRGGDPNVEAEFGEGPGGGAEVLDAEAAFLKEIGEIQKRNSSGGNRRKV